MKGLSLYEFNERCRELVAEIETATADENDELIAELEATLAELTPASDKKRESYVHVIQSSQGHAAALREEASRLTSRARQMETLANRLTDALHQDLVENGEVQAQAGLFQLKIADSPPRVVLSVPAESLPESYRRVTYAANMLEIRSALKAGIEIDGAELEQRTHLRIK